MARRGPRKLENCDAIRYRIIPRKNGNPRLHYIGRGEDAMPIRLYVDDVVIASKKQRNPEGRFATEGPLQAAAEAMHGKRTSSGIMEYMLAIFTQERQIHVAFWKKGYTISHLEGKCWNLCDKPRDGGGIQKSQSVCL